MKLKKSKKTIKETVKKGIKYPEFIRDKFKDEEVHVVASGPSLVGFDYKRLKGKNVIAVNHAFKMVQHSFCIFVDKGFPRVEAPEVIKESVCVSRVNPEFPSLIVFDFAKKYSINPDEGVWHRKSSGAISVCAALQSGASKVYLYGFDCKFFTSDEARAAAKHNGVDNYKTKLDLYGHATSEKFKHQRDRPVDEIVFQQTIQVFASFPRDKIVNMSKFSAIPYFDKSKQPYV